jgi:hypothetical protein
MKEDTPHIGHGNGTGNSIANKNKIEVSFLNWKPQKREIIQQGASNTGIALMVGSGLALGAAAAWGASKWLEGGNSEKKEGEEEVETHLTASMQLDVLKRRRLRMGQS